MMYIELKDGLVFRTKAKNELDLGTILNDAGFFITIENVGNINKLLIKRSFKLGDNPILEWISQHPYHEQVAMQGIMKRRMQENKNIDSYKHLLDIYNTMKQNKEISSLEIPFYVQSQMKQNSNLSLDMEDAEIH